MVFNARPGELFVVRNVANIVPPYGPDEKPHGVSSAIEFRRLRSLQVREIGVVLGHAMCRGGIHALLQRRARTRCPTSSANGVRIAEPARQRAMKAPPDRQQDVCEHEAVQLSLDNLLSFPWIKDAVEAGHLTLHGCFFDIRSGVLERLDADGIFRHSRPIGLTPSALTLHTMAGLVPAAPIPD